jgi:hypothetical protein
LQASQKKETHPDAGISWINGAIAGGVTQAAIPMS